MNTIGTWVSRIRRCRHHRVGTLNHGWLNVKCVIIRGALATTMHMWDIGVLQKWIQGLVEYQLLGMMQGEQLEPGIYVQL